ncbi:MAG: M20/M25/M40 family metallo-hydrolase [Pseudomonadales bacterium]|nr:M20/M25/M40 family metallo-hydrolase [Pseudomonadales bacterium]
MSIPVFDQSAIAAFTENSWETSILPTLCDYIRIPNKSPMFDPDWSASGHMHRAIRLLDGWTKSLSIPGMTTRIVELPGRTPLLLCEIPGTVESDTCVLLYGHYDKQPEFDGWEAGLTPWEPVLRDGRLYGRGGADDGYALFASLTAIAALAEQDIPYARCVVLIEGCEESGSFDLPHYVSALTEEIGHPDLVICLDAECGNYEQLWTTTSLRGMLPGNLTVRVLEEGQHSGAAGGIVPSSFRILRNLLDRIEDSTTGALHAALQVDIPAGVRAELERVAQVLGPEVIHRYPWAGDTRPESDDTVELLMNNAWRPSLATVGLGGAPSPGNAGNTLRPATTARLVFRLPPSLDAATAAAAVKQEFERDPPHGAQVTFEVDTPQTGWCAPGLAAWLEQAQNDASQLWFGKPAMRMGMGGTIPFMKMLGESYPGVQFMVTGVLGPKSNAHGPNEFLEIRTAKRLTGCVALVLARHAQQHGRQ